MKVDEVRKRCFRICKERFGNTRDIRMSLTKQGIREILQPFKDVDWQNLEADKPHPTDPGDVEMRIEDTGEKAAQRAILRQGETRIDDYRMRWIDAEVPVCPGESPRRRCLDLLGARMIGSPREENPLEVRRLKVVELKFTTPPDKPSTEPDSLSNSPPYAMFEGLAYGMSLYANRVSNGGDLWGHRHLPIDATFFPDVLVAANRSYWQAWGRALGDNARYLWLLQHALRDLMSPAFEHHRSPLFNWAVFPDINFMKQREKSGGSKYEPRIPARTKGWVSVWDKASKVEGFELNIRKPATDIYEAL